MDAKIIKETINWKITFVNYPHGDTDKVGCLDMDEVWSNLNGLKLEKKFPDCIEDERVKNQMENLWEGNDPIAWMRLYNENINLPNERLLVWDIEENKFIIS